MKLRPLKCEKVIRVLHKLGFEEIRQKGNHRFLKHTDGRTTVICREYEYYGFAANKQSLFELSENFVLCRQAILSEIKVFTYPQKAKLSGILKKSKTSS